MDPKGSAFGGGSRGATPPWRVSGQRPDLPPFTRLPCPGASDPRASGVCLPSCATEDRTRARCALEEPGQDGMEGGTMRRRTLLAAAGMAGAGLGGFCGMGVGTPRAVAAAAFPSRTLTLVVPFTPGSSIGINARLLQPHLERALGQNVDLQFVPGGGGLAGHLVGVEAA